MSSKTSTRNRGVTVSLEGTQVINAAILETWKVQGNGRKLTRKARSSLLGLAVATTDKLLAGQIVDRASVLLACSELGIEWRESFLEPLTGDLSTSLEAETQKPKSKRGWLLSVSLLICIFAGGTRFVLWRNALDYLDKCYERGNTAFQKGDYAEARRQMALYHANAASQDSAGRLAAALRLDGDIIGVEGNFKVARERFVRSMNLRQELQEYWYYPGLYEAIGCAETRMGDLKSAKVSFDKSLSGYREAKDMVGVAMAQRGLGSVQFLGADTHGAIEYFDKALGTLQSSRLLAANTDLEMDITARRACARARVGLVSGALKELEGCLSHWESKKHSRWIATTCLQIASAQILERNSLAAEQSAIRSQMLFRQVGDKAGEKEAADVLSEVERYVRTRPL